MHCPGVPEVPVALISGTGLHEDEGAQNMPVPAEAKGKLASCEFEQLESQGAWDKD